MAKGRFFKFFLTIFKKGHSPDFPPEISKEIRVRMEQSVRNGTRLTVVFLDSDARWNSNHCLADCFSQRILLIISRICIHGEIVFFPAEKECALLFEATVETAESVMAQATEILRYEDVKLRYKSRVLI